ncbi:serine/threonine-protein phosphatase 6 regulatory ankyrin repeat subunit A-like [Haliotis cracherodii]|uniref:serine/threonine-protein phosphatase 6 regulatory ankyrin repeat subunit A-like n=1 Tax=Haliotis cracherodii TaxID=6455 RepID=UPI0039EC591B
MSTYQKVMRTASHPSEMEALRPGAAQESDLPATSRKEETRRSGIPQSPDTRVTVTPTSARRDIHADSDLRDSSSEGNMASVKRILEAGWVDVNSRGGDSLTPVISATLRGHRKVVELLVSEGADVSLVNVYGDNILHLACMGGHMETVKFVLSLNLVDINSRGLRSRTPVMKAALKGHREVVELLVSDGADVSLVNVYGDNTLHLACRRGHIETAKFVLSLNLVDINSRGWRSRTPVMRATVVGHREVVELLVSEGADVSLVDDDGNNIFHLACAGGDVGTVKFVLSLNVVDIDARNNIGQTAGDNARLRRYQKIVKLLEPPRCHVMDNLSNESTHTERLRQVETEYYTLHRYWVIEDYDEVSQLPDQQQGPAEEDSDSDPALPVLADFFPGALDTEDNSSDPALSVSADYVPGPPATKDSNGDPALPVLADYVLVTPATKDSNDDPALPCLADYLTGTLDTANNISDPALPVLVDYLPGTPDTEDNNSDPALPCLAEYFLGAPGSDNSGFTVYGEEECGSGKYGADCNLHCPENCNLAKDPPHCDKDGKCYEGCVTVPVEEDCEPGKYGDGCKLNCSDNCGILPNTSLHCNKDNGSCSEGYTTYGSSKVVTTRVAPTNRSSLDSVHAQIIIPVVTTVLVVLVGIVCAVIFVRRCRKKGNSDGKQGEREDTNLHIACKRGNVEEVEHVLSSGLTDMNSRGLGGWTPLMAAARYGQRDVFDFLVSKGCDGVMVDDSGADLSRVNDSGNNILHVACIGGHVKILKYILSQNIVNINKEGQDGLTSVLAAAAHGRRDVLELLVNKGADLSLVDNHGNNILHCACTGGHLAVVQHILNNNILDINSKGKHSMTPVMISAEAGHRHVFDFLVYEGAYLSHLDDNGNNILHLACLSGSVMIVKYLLSKTIVDINSKGQFRRTPVMMAAKAGQRDVFVLLVSKGADLSLVDEHNDNILHLACRLGHPEMVRFVLAQSIVDIDCTGRHMRTPVMMAAENGHKEVFNVLASEGADLSNIDASGNSILHLGCLGGSEGIVQHILSHKVVDINALNNGGSKAVTIANEQGHSSICDLLVSQPTH